MSQSHRYSFTLATRDEDQLHAELNALGVGVALSIAGSGDTVQVVAPRELAPTEQQAVAGVVNAHVPDPVKAKQRAASDAMRLLLTSPDPALRGIVALFRLAFTLVNDERANRGQTRIQEPQLIQHAVGLMLAEEPPPTVPPISPGGG